MTADGLVPRALLDRAGRIWRWHLRVAHSNVFGHQDMLRTEWEIENKWEPIIEVRDPRLLRVRLIAVPAVEIRLGDWVVLPLSGELSPVIGVYPVADLSMRRLSVCTENGDWVRRGEHSPLLRADLSTARAAALVATEPRSTTVHNHSGIVGSISSERVIPVASLVRSVFIATR